MPYSTVQTEMFHFVFLTVWCSQTVSVCFSIISLCLSANTRLSINQNLYNFFVCLSSIPISVYLSVPSHLSLYLPVHSSIYRLYAGGCPEEKILGHLNFLPENLTSHQVAWQQEQQHGSRGKRPSILLSSFPLFSSIQTFQTCLVLITENIRPFSIFVREGVSVEALGGGEKRNCSSVSVLGWSYERGVKVNPCFFVVMCSPYCAFSEFIVAISYLYWGIYGLKE